MEMKTGSIMRMYSAEELDVMAEAYLKALDKLPVESPTTALTQRLVQEIGAGVASGIRDEDALAAAALRRSNLWPDLFGLRAQRQPRTA
jgi:phosphosulfolactate synthase (CoM biosynthesis protein A)